MVTELKLHALSYRYEHDKPWVFRDLELVFSPGLYGLIGQNGSGKTTLIKCIAGILLPSQGSIEFIFQGKRLVHQSFRERLSYVSQEFAFYEEMRVEKYLTYIAEMKLIPRKMIYDRVDQVLRKFNLYPLRRTHIEVLSTGQRKKLMLAQALLADPYLILLDEPLEGLDIEERFEVLSLLQQLAKQRVIIMVTHMISEIEHWLEQVIFMLHTPITAPKTVQQWKSILLHENWSNDQQSVQPTLEDVFMHLLNQKRKGESLSYFDASNA